MGKRLILHVGQSKTGTSTIQDFFAQNSSSLLRGSGLLYPNAGRQGAAHHRIAALFLPAGNGGWIKREDAASLRRRLSDECAASGATTVVASSEALYNARSLDEVRAFFADFDVEVLVILRRQDRWLDSLYQHQLKVGETSLDRHAWLKARLATLDYAARVGRWADAFGDAAIRLGVFEPANLSGGLLDFFFRTARLAAPADLVEPPPRNERLSRDALAYLCARPPGSLDAAGRQRLRRALERYSREHPDPPELRYFFSPEERREIIDRCRESNAALARRFLPDSGGVLFNDLDVEARYAPFAGPTSAQTAAIARAVAAEGSDP